ncbi:hypothetical protein O181_098080 [Austropuccinia psidii MF-1]|uniref:Uncharacterized protein n=1 Tax=Austropuccinia psidii MF-1 TaxID=1389203 RepID=A0A9Q3PEJ7_9BASI|nr:hypothetical protein [Austropuccinia psidii MF-1]
MAPRPPLKCAYCKEEGHSPTRCTHLAEDLDRRIVRTQGASYVFPNYKRIPMEGNESAKNIKPPTISSANDPFESHIGLRQTKQRMERQSQSKELKKKAAIPGTYIEEEKEEERVIIPTKFQNSNIPKPDQPEGEIENIANKNDEEISKEEKKLRKPQKQQVETILEIDKIIKKIMQQKINLTLEEILRMSPNFVHKLQEL